MRGSGWVLPGFALLVWLACIAWPGLALTVKLATLQQSDVETHSLWSLLGTTIAWSAAVALAAIFLGWIPGRVLGKAMQGPRSAFVPLAVLALAPMCLPSYIVFYAWWQSWPADSAFHQWVVANQAMGIARMATLFLGLVCWSWPLVSWSVAGFATAMPAQREEQLILDGAGPLRRMFDQLRNDAGGLALGGLLVFLATLANTTCFDLAEVFTFSNELRAIQALGANEKDVVIAALPAIVISLGGAVVVWRLLSSRNPQRETAIRVRPVSAWAAGSFSIIWTCSVVVPLGLFAWNLFQAGAATDMSSEFFTLYKWSLANTLFHAVVSGTIAAAVSIGLIMMWMADRQWISRSADAVAISWIVLALIPGTLTGVGLQAAYNRGWFEDLIAKNPVILNIAHLACFGFVSALMARWTALREPAQLRDLRRLDGAHTLPGVIQTNRPRILAAAFATFAIVIVLSMGEIAVTAVVSPPHRAGAGPLALTLLNDMHYQRPQTVMMASILLILLSIITAIVVALVWVSRTRHAATFQCRSKRIGAVLGVLCVCVGNTGCTPEDPESPEPLNSQLTFGRAGTAMGQFAYPRAIDVDPQREFLYVIDKQARVQRFGFDGKPQTQWMMPEFENGKPTGVSVASDGRVFVADTHYFRVIAYDSQGNELMRFGEMGRGPGQFIYVTDIAFGPNRRLYVSEYGGNDRVQVFDEAGQYLFEFSSLGEHGRFSRPQSLTFNHDLSELFIADACNHRIVVVTPEGIFLREFGVAGRGAGQLTYPYGLTVLRDGSVLVAEFGNNRLQRFEADGKPVGIFGALGRGEGQLQYPWGVAATRDRVFVLDSGNNRVQVIRTP